MFEKIKKWYSQGLWSTEMVEQAAQKGVITEDQRYQILNQ